MNRINTLLIDEKILNKRNQNLDSYYVNGNTSPDNNNFSETPHNNILFNTSTDDTEPIFPVTSKTPSINERDQHQLILFLNLLLGLHLQTVKVWTWMQFQKKLRFKVLKTTFYKTFTEILYCKYNKRTSRNN